MEEKRSESVILSVFYSGLVQYGSGHLCKSPGLSDLTCEMKVIEIAHRAETKVGRLSPIFSTFVGN